MVNMINFIKQQSASILKIQEHAKKKSCDCRIKDNCPLDGKYLRECIMYQANVITNNKCKEYFGTAAG